MAALALALLALVAMASLAGVAQAGASASGPARASAGVRSAIGAQPASCLIHSLPSFIAQGEFQNEATVGDVIEVECNPYVYGTGAAVTITAAQLNSRCHEITWYVPDEPGGVVDDVPQPDAGFVTGSGPSIELHLDVDGNANVALIAGPHCMVGESLITLDEDESPYETFTTSFQVVPDIPTLQGVYTTPSSQVEDAASSAVATVVQAEFTGAAEAKVRVGAEQLYDRCQLGEHLIWVRENRETWIGPELAGEHAIELDDDGNGFALAIGSDSCAQGSSLVEADLEQSPFTTLTTSFEVLPPQPTEEPGFTIVKTQQISGSGSTFTTAPLTTSVGKTVDYAITVTNTTSVPETFTGFTDPHCDAGTISGGPGPSPVASGAAATYTCSHLVTAPGTYVNEATVTGNTVGGRPLTQTSNQVEVNAIVPMVAFTIEKFQRIAGSGEGYTTAVLTGRVGQTVEYEIVVHNTGNVSLNVYEFGDSHCDHGTVVGEPKIYPFEPGASATYTCTHLLANAGPLVNVAFISGAPPEGPVYIKESNHVEVKVLAPEPGFTSQKLQRIAGSGQSFTTAPLEATEGATLEYEIVLVNAGNAPLKFSSFSDPHCDSGTLAGGPGEGEVAPGGSTTYTCTRKLAGPGKYENVATVTATPPGEEPLTATSNEVVATVPAQAPATPKPPVKKVLGEKCEASPHPLRGVGGPQTGAFTAWVSSKGILRITFFLDGRRLRAFKHTQSRHGRFTLKLDARRLSYGVHTLSFTTVMANSACARTASARRFVRPHEPRFTG